MFTLCTGTATKQNLHIIIITILHIFFSRELNDNLTSSGNSIMVNLMKLSTQFIMIL